MIIEQEEKFKAVLSELKGKVNEQTFFNKFLELHPKAWKKHKAIYNQFQNSSKFGNTIPLPKPEVSLRKEIRIFLNKQQ